MEQHVERVHFTSSREYHAWCVEAKNAGRLTTSTWGYGLNERGMEKLEKGDLSHVQLVEEFRNQIWDQLEVPHKAWGSSVAGAFPNVPAFLAGEPENMWLLQDTDSDRSPIRIWVGVTSSAGITADQLARRGAALTAFATALSEHRPVYLSPYVNLGNSTGEAALISWDLQTSPLVMSEVTACLIDVNVIRHLSVSACRALNPKVTVHWMEGYDDEQYMREQLGTGEHDLFLSSINLKDPLLREPVQWIKNHLQKFINQD